MERAAVSVVLPCLNEEGTIAACVEEARRGLAALGRGGEVLVVDNGSGDDSVRRAREAGARVVSEPRRGYGSALGRGLREASGSVILLADADGSYRLDDLAPLVEATDRGADVVLGSRLQGRREPGAMPWLHRWLGTPVLTSLVNLLFRAKITDVNTGMRALRAEAAHRLDLRAAGMEFASEMVIKAVLAGMSVQEVPVDYHRDRRGRPPHLRPWRDGWRHLRFILLFAPNVFLVAPGLAAVLAGAILGAPALFGRSVEPPVAWAACAFTLLGAQLIQVGLIAKTWYHVEGFYRRAYLDRLFRVVSLETGLLAGAGLLATGVILVVPVVGAWRSGVRPDAGRLAAALSLLVLGAQAVATSMILSVLGIRRRRPE